MALVWRGAIHHAIIPFARFPSSFVPVAKLASHRLPVVSLAARSFFLQLFVALSEQAPHRRALVSTPGLLHSASSYVVSTTKNAAPSSPSSSPADSAEAAAFRLLGNLAYSDGTRRRITELDGLVLATARALSASARGLAPACPSPPVDAVAADGTPPCHVSTCSSSMVGVGEATAALLGRLTPVLGVEGGEDELVAAGEALSEAVTAVSKATRVSDGGDGAAAQAGGVGSGRLLELASESLSGLLVLSWSDSCSLDVAAAVDSFITDSSLADGVVALWRRATTVAAASSPPDFGTLPASSLALMSSIACRPTGRQALVAAGVASAVVDVAFRPSDGGGGQISSAAGGGNGGGDGLLQLTVTERSEVIRLLCVLCASPAHRVAVRSALISATVRERRGGDGGGVAGSDGAGDSGGEDEFEVESDETAVEAAIVRIQGGGNGGNGGSGFGLQDCRAGACRLAFLLGVAPPAPPPSRRLPRQGTAAGAGAFAADHLSAAVPAGSARGPPQPSSPAAEIQQRPTAASAASASSPRPAGPGNNGGAFSKRSGGGGSGGWAGAASRLEDDAASVDSQELEEALFPTTTTTTTTTATEAPVFSGAPPAAAAATRQESSGLPSLPRIPSAAAATAPAPGPSWRPLPPAPTPAPRTTRSESEESLHRLLSMIAKTEGEDSATTTHPGAVGVQTAIPEERGRFESRGAGGGLYGSGGGGGAGSATGEDKTRCKTCGKLVFAPTGFDLALIDCPHCGQSMG